MRIAETNMNFNFIGKVHEKVVGNCKSEQTLTLWTEWTSQHLGADTSVRDTGLFRLIAQFGVGNRPERIEPRQRKRRPKSYPWLKVPRAQARQQIRTH